MKSMTKAMCAAVLLGSTMPALAQDRDDRAPRRESSRHVEGDRDRDRRGSEGAVRADWLSREDVTRKLVAGGLKVERIKADHGRYEVYATEASGARVKVYVDPTNAEIIRRERSDRR